MCEDTKDLFSGLPDYDSDSEAFNDAIQGIARVGEFSN